MAFGILHMGMDRTHDHRFKRRGDVAVAVHVRRVVCGSLFRAFRAQICQQSHVRSSTQAATAHGYNQFNLG